MNIQSESQSKQSLLLQNEIEFSQDDKKQENVSFIRRAFGPIRKGSFRAIIFALLASAMGTGIFNLPLRVSEIGIIFFVLFISAATFYSYIGMILLIELIQNYKIRSFSAMAYKCYGKIFMRIVQFCLIIYPYGINICFQVIIAKFVVQLINDIGNIKLYENRQSEFYNKQGNLIRIIVNLSVIVLNLFLILKKQIGILQKLSFIGVIMVIFNALVIIIVSFIGFQENIKGQLVEYKGIFSLSLSNVRWIRVENWDDISLAIQGLASIVFCFVSHQLVFPLSTQLKKPTITRFSNIFFRVHCVQFIVYIFMGITSYLLLNQYELIPISPMVTTSIKILPLTIGKMGLILSLFLALPLNFFAARMVTYQAFKIEKSNRNHILISITMASTTCAIAIAFQSVNSYFGLLGGTAGVGISGLIPAICSYKLKSQLTLKDYGLYCFIGIFAFFAIIGAILSIVNPIN